MNNKNRTQESQRLFQHAQRYIPGGVNSPVRAFRGVGGDPVFIRSAQGAHLYDVDGNSYIDYLGSWGPMILGHNHVEVIAAIKHAVDLGLSFGAPTEIEGLMAETLCRLIPSIELIRMVNSGTEATMTALRLARGHTGRDKIIKFEGCYHGHSDSLLVKAGSGALTFGVPTSPGVPAALAEHTLTLTYNNLDEVEQTFQQRGADIAAVIVEPVAGNMNCILPVPGFLQGLRTLCDRYGAVLIFDEVLTGFRVALGGAQTLYGVRPDLTTLGKIIGGGMPVGAVGGQREIMEKLSPLGPIYQAGTLSGNPIAMAAGLKTLTLIQQLGFYQQLSARTQTLMQELRKRAAACGVAFSTNQVGALFGLFFSPVPQVHSFAQACACDIEAFKLFFHAMLQQGVYLAPSAFEAGFVSAAHTDEDIQMTADAAEQAFKKAAAK